jgi:copper chaperone CopZ
MKQTELRIDIDDYCSTCADNIQKALEILEGVEKATVEFEKRKASVSYDETRIQPKRMLEVIERAGYHAQH